jgi:tetratricopeptide (TPR) repeat protein
VALYHKRLGAVLFTTNDFPAALAEYRAALAIDEPRLVANPTDQRAKLDLSYDYSDIGLILRRTGKLADSLDEYRKAYRLRAEAAATDPRNERAAVAVASVASRLAGVYDDMGSFRQAQRVYDQALSLAEAGRRRFPESRSALVQLADNTLSAGVHKQKRHACGQATELFQRALDLYRNLKAEAQIHQAEELIRACAAAPLQIRGK